MVPESFLFVVKCCCLLQDALGATVPANPSNSGNEDPAMYQQQYNQGKWKW